jgi:hypothetical protein
VKVEDPKDGDGSQDLVDDVYASLVASTDALQARLAARKLTQQPDERSPSAVPASANSSPRDSNTKLGLLNLIESFHRLKRLLPQRSDGIDDRRRRDLAEFASGLARSGLGRITAEAILLSINGLELNERFRTEHPEWHGISDKTLERDRAHCEPKIRVRMGRPRTSD